MGMKSVRVVDLFDGNDYVPPFYEVFNRERWVVIHCPEAGEVLLEHW